MIASEENNLLCKADLNVHGNSFVKRGKIRFSHRSISICHCSLQPCPDLIQTGDVEIEVGGEMFDRDPVQ